MDQQEQQERRALIEKFETVSGVEGADRLHEKPGRMSDHYYQALSELVTHFGYDDLTQSHIMLALDEVQDRKPLRTVRGVTLSLIHRACTLKQESLVDSPQAYGFEKMEERLSLLWRHQLLSDKNTPLRAKEREYTEMKKYSPSKPLQEELKQVEKNLFYKPGYSFYM